MVLCNSALNKVKTQRITWIENYPLEAPARLEGRRMKRVFKEEFGYGKGRRGGNEVEEGKCWAPLV